METKICTRCEKEFPATEEYFYKRKEAKDGFRKDCKECFLKKSKSHREGNKEYYKKYNEQYRKQNKEKRQAYIQQNKIHILEKEKEWRENNKEKLQEQYSVYNSKYYIQNKKEIQKRTQEYRKEHKEYYKEYFKRYRKEYMVNNRDKLNIYTQKRRAKIRQLPNTLTLTQWEYIKTTFNHECAYCGKSEEQQIQENNTRLEQEHFIPVTKGGGYTIENIIPSCRSCNCSKSNSDFFEWYPKQDFYDKQREQYILEYLNQNETQKLIQAI